MSEWISVKKALPDILRDVFVYRISFENKDGITIFKMHPCDRYKVAFFSNTGWHFHEDLSIRGNSRVSHWMELPEAPK